MDVVVPLLTALVSLLFALTVLDQYLERRRPYQLAWTAGLLLYALGSTMLVLRETAGLTELVFRLWYFSGAMLVPAYLGVGTVYLLAPPKVARLVMGLLLIATIFAGGLVFSAPLEQPLSALSPEESLTGKGFLPLQVRFLTVVLNSAGTIALVGGAVWSAVVFARRRRQPRRALSNALIAGGALVSAAGGALDSLGLPEPHALALLVGVVVIYLGFLLSREVFAAYRVPFLSRLRSTSSSS